VDLLDEIVRELKQKNKDVSAEADSDDEDEPVDVLATPLAELEKPRRKRKKKLPKYQAPGYIFILDDMSRLLREPSITEFLKMHRHFKAKIIISSQYPNDILPESWLQLDYIILFKGHPDKKLEEIYKVADIPISLNRFIQLYKFATMARPKNRVFLKENRPPFSKSAPQGVGRAARTLGRVRLPSDLALQGLPLTPPPLAPPAHPAPRLRLSIPPPPPCASPESPVFFRGRARQTRYRFEQAKVAQVEP